MPDQNAPVLTEVPLAGLIAIWRPGSGDWDWVTEYTSLVDLPVTEAIEKRVLNEGIGFADEHSPIMLGSDGRVWDGHHRIILAIKHGISSVKVEGLDDPIPSLDDDSATSDLDARRRALLRSWIDARVAARARAASDAPSIDRDALSKVVRPAVGSQICNVMNYPRPVQAGLLGLDLSKTVVMVTEAVLDALQASLPDLLDQDR